MHSICHLLNQQTNKQRAFTDEPGADEHNGSIVFRIFVTASKSKQSSSLKLDCLKETLHKSGSGLREITRLTSEDPWPLQTTQDSPHKHVTIKVKKEDWTN